MSSFSDSLAREAAAEAVTLWLGKNFDGCLQTLERFSTTELVAASKVTSLALSPVCFELSESSRLWYTVHQDWLLLPWSQTCHNLAVAGFYNGCTSPDGLLEQLTAIAVSQTASLQPCFLPSQHK